MVYKITEIPYHQESGHSFIWTVPRRFGWGSTYGVNGDARDLFWESVFSPGDLGCSCSAERKTVVIGEDIFEDTGYMVSTENMIRVQLVPYTSYIRSIRFASIIMWLGT